MFEDKACKREYKDGDTQFVAGIKVMTVKDRWSEQCGPTRINQPTKTEMSCPTRKEDQCPFKINICLNKKDDLFYLSKIGSVSSHCGHAICST
jgi:hypothetical protein